MTTVTKKTTNAQDNTAPAVTTHGKAATAMPIAAPVPGKPLSWAKVATLNGPPPKTVLALQSPGLTDHGAWLEVFGPGKRSPDLPIWPDTFADLDSSEYERLAWGNITHLFIPYWRDGVADALDGRTPRSIANFYDRLEKCGADVMWATPSVINGEREMPQGPPPQFGNFDEEGEGYGGWDDGSAWGEEEPEVLGENEPNPWDTNVLQPDWNVDVSPEVAPNEKVLPLVLGGSSENTDEWHEVKRKHKSKSSNAGLNAKADRQPKTKPVHQVTTRRRRSNWH